jgi:hypothetical protein
MNTFSLGYLDERTVNSKVYQITKDALGEEHLATQIQPAQRSFIPHLVYPDSAWKADDHKLELEKDFDRSSVSYIA